MSENKSLNKVEEWFLYYKYVYAIFLKNIIMSKDGRFSMLLSSFNTIPSEDDNYSIGQMLKLELLKGKEPIESISIKMTDEEEYFFQYVWALVVNHFIKENFDKDSIIGFDVAKNSTRSFKTLESNVKIEGVPIAKADFGITYNKDEYENFLKKLIFNHNEGIDSEALIAGVRNYLLEYDEKLSEELNSSLKKSAKVYQHLKHQQKLF